MKVLVIIALEGDGSTEPGDLYLSCLPDIYSNASVCPVVRPHLPGRHLNDCNAIDNHNRMQNYDLEIYKYWITKSGYFRIATTVELGMGIADGKILFYHFISEGNV